MSEFAASIGIDEIRLEQELVRFKNHANHYTKPLRSVTPTFRNWLRRSVEFEYARLENSRRLLALQPVSFKEFLAKNVATVVKHQRGAKEIG